MEFYKFFHLHTFRKFFPSKKKTRLTIKKLLCLEQNFNTYTQLEQIFSILNIVTNSKNFMLIFKRALFKMLKSFEFEKK